ncbi:unnamed protein product [Nezara viridula]|uniref:Nuclear pore protein n=1 Tax=Nezara viridula TaxID=85310 RepID=A0A9P0DZZ3_NEZVI|nr:unnamed protein product [Nezara viridula]
MAEADFSDLVYEAEQLASEFEGIGDLPKVERSLKQILEESQTLWSRVTATGAQDIQANLLLGTKGLDLPQVTQKLQILSSRKTFEPLDPIPVTDIQNFLKNESENAILQLIESTNKSTFDSVEKLHTRKLFEEWGNHKINLMNSLLGYSKEIVDVPLRRERTVLNESLFGMQSSLSQEDIAYAQCLIEYNNADIQRIEKPNILKQFSQTAEKFNNQKINEMWKMLRFMAELRPSGVFCDDEEDILAVRSRKVAQDAMIRQALAYLEQRYKEYMTSAVAYNRNTARIGGIPGTFPLVSGFVRIKVRNEPGLDETTKDGIPLWPLVYYCLRCGDIPAAIQALEQSGKPKNEMISALSDLLESPSRHLSLEKEKEVKDIYRRVVRSSPDPYKRAVYCILGSCDIHDDHRQIATTADDYLWIKLWQLREEEPEPMHDSIHYSLLQSLVLEEYGESYYKAQEQPHVFFQMLVLTGQWESAIDFLVRLEKFKAHGVHMAIALYHLGLLALPKSINAPLLVIDESDKPPMRRLNLPRLVLMYTRAFENSDPKETLHYYYTLRKLPANNDRNAFETCIINHVVENKQYDLILGRVDPYSGVVPGLLSIFKDKIDLNKIIQSIAQITESRGLFEDAIKLYDLCGDHNKVLQLLNHQLSQYVSKSGIDLNSPRNRLVKLATDLFSRYDGHEINSTPATLSCFCKMRELIEFFDLYHLREYEKALDVIQRTGLIPMIADDVEKTVSNFRLLDECISRNIPDILLAMMNIYHSQYQKMRGSVKSGATKLEDVAKSKQLSFIRERARLLTSFAGTIPYRMPGDTNSRLVHLEIMMT